MDLLPPTMKGALDDFVDGEVDVHAFDDYPLPTIGSLTWLNFGTGPCMRCEDGTAASADLGLPSMHTNFRRGHDRSAHATKLTRPCVGEPYVRDGS